MFKKDCTSCPKYVNHSRPNSQHNPGDLYDHLMFMRILTLTMNKDIYMSSKNYEENGIANNFALNACFAHCKKWMQS